MALRFLLDENLRGPLWAAVSRATARRALPLEITCVGEETELTLGMSNPDPLFWGEQRGFVLVSNDVRTMPERLIEAEHFGRLRLGQAAGLDDVLDMNCENRFAHQRVGVLQPKIGKNIPAALGGTVFGATGFLGCHDQLPHRNSAAWSYV